MLKNNISEFYEHIQAGNFLPTQISSVRDLSKIDIHEDYSIVVAVDSDGGIGPRKDDQVFCPGYELGRFAMRVPLLEVLACGARPMAAYDMLTLPMDDIGREILRGIKDELRSANFGEDFHLSGSTEDNVPTTMTGIGTTVIGLVKAGDFKPGTSVQDDLVICLGKPKSAPEDEVYLDDPEIIHQADVLKIRDLQGVHDILPVGSHGIAYESEQLASSADLIFSQSDTQISLTKSAGPSTCIVVSLTDSACRKVESILKVPLYRIGKMISHNHGRRN